MSIGNVSQALSFERDDLTLVLGENLDLGGDDAGARNGTGKCVEINTVVKVRNNIKNEIYETVIGKLYNIALSYTLEENCLDVFEKDNKNIELELSNTFERKFVKSLPLKNLEIETDSGWQKISSIHKTIPYQIWHIITESDLILKCADDHIVFDHNMNEIFVKDIIPNKTLIKTKNGFELVTYVNNTSKKENMYDISVDSHNHRYYTNGILSHNTTIINALSYALFGSALSKIGKDNLVNKTNNKHMLVTCEFNQNGTNYRIERGRKPNILKFFIDNHETLPDSNESQGDSRITQTHIENIIRLSHNMFKHIVALNTYTEPFLALRTQDQREVIEQLLGITLLSEKAELLKEEIRETKDKIREEELTIKATLEANKKIEETIINLQRRQSIWNNIHKEDILHLEESIAELNKVDIKSEIQAHKDLVSWTILKTDINNAKKEYNQAAEDEHRTQQDEIIAAKNLKLAEKHKCHACGQEVHDDNHNKLMKELLEVHLATKEKWNKACEHMIIKENVINAFEELSDEPKVYYNDHHDATEHKTTLTHLKEQLKNKKKEKDPYDEQVKELQNEAIQIITYDHVNVLSEYLTHQDFLFKLLTKKDSFIRKKIIDQNLSYLNKRLKLYLTNIGLPHEVIFMNDLSVQITELGRELDFDNLSRGERNRLILSLSWSFRDVYESLYEPINLLFIDELLDSGLDQIGMENSLSMLKKMTRDRNKSVFLISHRDELANRVNNVLKVIKSNGFTEFI